MEDIPQTKPGDRTPIVPPQGVPMWLLNLRRTIEERIEQLDTVEIYGSGQTTEEPFIGDITFEYVGRKYKVTIEDRGEIESEATPNQQIHDRVTKGKRFPNETLIEVFTH